MWSGNDVACLGYQFPGAWMGTYCRFACLDSAYLGRVLDPCSAGCWRPSSPDVKWEFKSVIVEFWDCRSRFLGSPRGKP